MKKIILRYIFNCLKLGINGKNIKVFRDYIILRDILVIEEYR